MTSIPVRQCQRCKYVFDKEFGATYQVAKELTAGTKPEEEGTTTKMLPKRCPKCGSDRLVHF